jgi:formylglycine-generating enzyme required for sulfatase activity
MGHFGVNDVGVADIAGNVWEWTDSCFQNGTVSADGSLIVARSDYCGVRAVQGKHRGFVIDFVRDARSGGCGAGVPPFRSRDRPQIREILDAAGTARYGAGQPSGAGRP